MEKEVIEYVKVKNVFEFDSKFKNIIGIQSPFKDLKEMTFLGTEKVDGTNTRIVWDGYNIEILGRTSKSVFASEILEELKSKYDNEEFKTLMEQNFGQKSVILFGELYGPKIQANGEKYSKNRNFILFDVNVEGFDLERTSVEDVAKKLALDVVPVVFEGTIQECTEMVLKHNASTISKEHEMEGIVLQPKIVLYDNKKTLIKGKVRYQDLKKVGLTENANVKEFFQKLEEN